MSKKILVIRSASMTFSRLANRLQDLFPACNFDLLTTAEVKDSGIYEQYKEIHNLPINSFSRDELTEEELNKLQGKNYDTVLILYNYSKDSSYLNVEKLAREIQPESVIGMDYYLNKYPLSDYSYPFRVFINSLKETTRSFINLLIRIISKLIVWLHFPLLILIRRKQTKDE